MPKKRRRAPDLRYSNARVVAPGVVVRGAAAIRKFGPVDMVKNDSPRLRPVPRPPFTAATYGPIEQSCPDTCAFKAPGENGVRPCFADAGFTKRTIKKLEEQASEMTVDQIAEAEAAAIDRTFRHGVPQDGARGGRDLRLHVSGDVTTAYGAQVLAAAAGRWIDRGGGSVWTYTHAWRTVPRSAWGRISVLASVERPWDAMRAQARGYAPALVVRAHDRGERTWSPENYPEIKILPCPYETRGVTCSSCRLCLDRDLRGLGLTIGFSMHGIAAAEGRRRLPVIT